MQEITGNWKKSFDYRFLAGEDLDGKTITLTIKAVGQDEAFNGKTKDKVVCLSFVETDKMIVLNRTNAKTITRNLGTPIVEKWKGQQIRVRPETIAAFGQQVTAIRVVLDIKSNQA